MQIFFSFGQAFILYLGPEMDCICICAVSALIIMKLIS